MLSSICVETGSRLHMGLLNVPGPTGPERWLDRDGNPTIAPRSFGGIGMMVEHPAIRVRVSRSDRWEAIGPAADRAGEWARQAAAAFTAPPPLRVEVEACPPAHVGLGTGTQLALAVGRAVARLLGRTDDVADAMGRGKRSGIGTHGFARGGFLVDGGRGVTGVAPLVARQDFPPEWGVLLIVPRNRQGVSGTAECEAFARMVPEPAARVHTDAMCRLVLLGLLPALREHDLTVFGEALYDFNRRAGHWFQACQGGIYGSPWTAAVIEHLRQSGLRGVGQSSWGPTVFAIDVPDRLTEIASNVPTRFGALDVHVTHGRNQGARDFDE